MVWSQGTDTAAMTTYLLANPGIKYLLLMNEPNLVDQANMTPSVAAAQWPKYEAIAKATGVKLVGPAITWGTMTNFSDPVVWMDAFIAAYKAANNGASPQIDYLAYHWYDYGLSDQLDSMKKYGKPIWVTEMANWHSQTDGAQIDTLAKQKTQMTEMVALCEGRTDVFRYAWFIGRRWRALRAGQVVFVIAVRKNLVSQHLPGRKPLHACGFFTSASHIMK
jgi:hypothetical protein